MDFENRVRKCASEIEDQLHSSVLQEVKVLWLRPLDDTYW